MGWHDRIAGLFSPIRTHNDHSQVSNYYENKNTYHRNVNLQINSTQTKILAISGSNNHGTMLNDAQFNLTTHIDRPVYLQFNQQPMFIYLIAISILIMKLLLLLACFYRHHQQQQQNDQRRHRQRRRVRRRRRQEQEQEQRQPSLSNEKVDIEISLGKEEPYDILPESATQWAYDKIMQYMEFN